MDEQEYKLEKRLNDKDREIQSIRSQLEKAEEQVSRSAIILRDKEDELLKVKEQLGISQVQKGELTKAQENEIRAFQEQLEKLRAQKDEEIKLRDELINNPKKTPVGLLPPKAFDDDYGSTLKIPGGIPKDVKKGILQSQQLKVKEDEATKVREKEIKADQLQILTLITKANGTMYEDQLFASLPFDVVKCRHLADQLIEEGYITRHRKRVKSAYKHYYALTSTARSLMVELDIAT